MIRSEINKKIKKCIHIDINDESKVINYKILNLINYVFVDMLIFGWIITKVEITI